MKEKILITGANGFIGSYLLHYFEDKNYEVYALDCQKSCKHEKVFKYYQRDIRKPFELDEKFDVVIHLAALNDSNVSGKYSYQMFEQVNVEGTKNVANSCLYKTFIMFSSANIYKRKGYAIDEKSEISPQSFYEQSKYAAEKIIASIVSPESLVILRPVNITGRQQRNQAMIPRFFEQASLGKTIEIYAPKNKKVQLLSVDDLGRALECFVMNKRVHGVFNVAGCDAIDMIELANRIVSLCDSNSNIQCTNQETEIFSEVKSDPIMALLNWRPVDTIEDILKDFKDEVEKCKKEN